MRGETLKGHLGGILLAGLETAPGPGSAGAHPGSVAELQCGLQDAAGARGAAGLRRAQDTQGAIDELGDPAGIAGGCRAEIAASQARRVVVTLLVTGPLVGLL